jgi:hypothetical protein
MKDTVQPKHREICRRLLESGIRKVQYPEATLDVGDKPIQKSF